ncbi:hypothetical protein CENSYa_1365 [Cenarchaeum symbiosum A]|uniref:Uncharacterized protein n=1 Tax=Cenarchaeum symbiosum (strain A) TaxID=414004 RepID=A0RXC1_CENSY|nr:hypothetical protein CENSYa_1365 [Cenarchaeum symbiosum A]
MKKRRIVFLMLFVPFMVFWANDNWGSGDATMPFDCRVAADADANNCHLDDTPGSGDLLLCHPHLPELTLCEIRVPTTAKECEELYLEYVGVLLRRGDDVYLGLGGYAYDRCELSPDELEKLLPPR